MKNQIFEQSVSLQFVNFNEWKSSNLVNSICNKNVLLFTVYHVDSALKISPACLKYKLLKAECLALLGRTEVSVDIDKLYGKNQQP